MRQQLSAALGKGTSMFASTINPVGNPGHRRLQNLRIDDRSLRLRFSLPRPLLLTLLFVFVVLPLAWPRIDGQSLDPTASEVLDLSGDMNSLALSADAKSLVVTGLDRPISVWNRGKGVLWDESQLPRHQPGGSRCLVVSPDAKVLGVGNMDGSITLWELSSGRNLASLAAGGELVQTIAFSPDGAMLAAGYEDSRIRLWDITDLRLRTVLEGHHGPVMALVFSFDGKTLISGGKDGFLRLWTMNLKHAQESTVLGEHSDIVLAVAASPNSPIVASSSLIGHGIQLWNLNTRESVGVLECDNSTQTCLTYTPDGGILIAGDEHGNVTIWSMGRRESRNVFPAHTGWVKGLAVSASGRTLFTGGNDGMVRIWDMAEVSQQRRTE